MTRASKINNNRVVKFEWPESPEIFLELVPVKFIGSDSNKPLADKRIIVKAISISGETWEGTEDPRLPGWDIVKENI
jgi:hypothetical protein